MNRKRKNYSREYNTGNRCRLSKKKTKNRKKKKRAYEFLEKTNEKSAEQPTLIIKEKEIVMVKCSYCGALMESTVTRCPNCGAPRRR